MKLLAPVNLFFMIFLFGSCSTSDRRSSGHHHHFTECSDKGCETRQKECKEKKCRLEECKMYEGRCALSVSRGDAGVKGKKEHRLVHEGHTYYFSSEESMHIFKENIDENITRADQNWDVFKWQQWR